MEIKEQEQQNYYYESLSHIVPSTGLPLKPFCLKECCKHTLKSILM